MRLLVFAHKKEAESFIDHLKFIPVPTSRIELYKNDSEYLLITNEGINEAMLNTSICLANFAHEINSIVNIGIAGSINSKIKIGKIVQVKTIYGKNHNSFEYQSFPTLTSSATVECLSVPGRVLIKEDKLKLTPIADIIDRESWGIAYAAKKFKIDFYSIKFISDDLESVDFCAKILNESEIISKKLLDYYRSEFSIVDLSLQDVEVDISYFINSDFLYFSVSQKRQLINILQSLKLQEFSLAEFINSAHFKSILENELKPKDRTKLLLLTLYSISNPLLASTKNKLDQIVKKFQTNSIQFKIDPTLANKELIIQLMIENKNSLGMIIADLSNFNDFGIEEYFDLLDGKL